MALLLLLLVPVQVVVRLTGDAASGVEVAVSWRLLLLHGGRRRRLTLPAAAAPPAPRIAERTPTVRLDAPAPSVQAPPPRAAGTARRRRGLRERLTDVGRTVDLVRRLLARRALRVARIDGRLEFALHDVGETGRAFGFLCALATLLDPDGRVALLPRWDTEDWLATDLELELRVQPLPTLLVLLAERLRRRGPAGVPITGDATGGPLAA